MISTISTIVATSIVVAGAIGTVLSGFYKTNKQATADEKILRLDFENKLTELKKELKDELKTDHETVERGLEKLSNKIDSIANQYVTVPSFKTYTESISQLLTMMNEKSTHIEASMDDMRDEISSILKILTQKDK